MGKIMVNGESYSGSEVVANPTLAGTEANLIGIEVDGTKYAVSGGGGGSVAEIIPITIGDNTNSRTFTFSKTPKYIKIIWYQGAESDSTWTSTFDFIWGSIRAYGPGGQGSMELNITSRCSKITYGSDGKSFTITGQQPYLACNSNEADAHGLLLVIY